MAYKKQAAKNGHQQQAMTLTVAYVVFKVIQTILSELSRWISQESCPLQSLYTDLPLLEVALTTLMWRWLRLSKLQVPILSIMLSPLSLPELLRCKPFKGPLYCVPELNVSWKLQVQVLWQTISYPTSGNDESNRYLLIWLFVSNSCPTGPNQHGNHRWFVIARHMPRKSWNEESSDNRQMEDMEVVNGFVEHAWPNWLWPPTPWLGGPTAHMHGINTPIRWVIALWAYTNGLFFLQFGT